MFGKTEVVMTYTTRIKNEPLGMKRGRAREKGEKRE
jgi:hypothetical protein